MQLSYYTIVGEVRRRLCGYIYFVCQNQDCGHVHCVPCVKIQRRCSKCICRDKYESLVRQSMTHVFDMTFDSLRIG